MYKKILSKLNVLDITNVSCVKRCLCELYDSVKYFAKSRQRQNIATLSQALEDFLSTNSNETYSNPKNKYRKYILISELNKLIVFCKIVLSK